MRYTRKVRTDDSDVAKTLDLAKIILYSAANVRGVFVCNREEFKRMSSALEIAGVHPIVDKVSVLRCHFTGFF